jgi:membrane fusion protein (multidrug efflux system)
MSSKIFPLAIFTAAILFGSGCKEKKEAPKELVLEVPVVQVLQQDVPLVSQFTGQTLGESDIQIAPRVTGLIESVNFKEGSFVKKGQLLYTVERLTYQNKVNVAQARVAEANTSLAVTKADYERLDALVKIKAVSERELEAARGKYEAAQEVITASKAELRNAKIDLGYCSITSPIDGMIGISKVQVGDYVSPGPMASINTVSDTKRIRVRFTLSEQEFLRFFRESQKAKSQLQGGNNIQLLLSDGSVYDQKGQYSFANRQVDPSTGAITMEALFDNPDKLLRPGQFVKVQVAAEVLKDALVIPQRAVIEMQGIYQVYVLGDSNKVDLKIIQPGQAFKDAYVVNDGLTAKDKIAFGGTQLLRSGSKITPKATDWQPGMSDKTTPTK